VSDFKKLQSIPAESLTLEGKVLDSLPALAARMDLPCNGHALLARAVAAAKRESKEVWLNASAAHTEHFLCEYQRSWVQLLLLLTRQGAVVARWMADKHRAYSGPAIRPAMGIRIPGDGDVQASCSKIELDAEESAEAAEHGLFDIVALVTGTNDAVRKIEWPSNRGFLVNFLAEVLLNSNPGEMSDLRARIKVGGPNRQGRKVRK